MSITLQKEGVVFTGKDAFSYVYQTEKSGSRLTAFFKALFSLRKVEVKLGSVQTYINKDSSKGLVRKLQSMSIKPSITFPLTQIAFDMMSRHRDIPCGPANQISKFLSAFCPMVERGQLNLSELLVKLDELDGLVKHFAESVSVMDDGMFRLAFRDLNGEKEEYLEKSTEPFDPDKDFSVKQFRQELLEMLEGHIVQFTSKVISNIDALSVEESGAPESGNGDSRSSAWDSALLEKRVSFCSPDSAIDRLSKSMCQEHMEKVLLEKEKEGFNDKQLDDWVHAYEAVDRYQRLAENLSKCHHPAYRRLGGDWQEKIDSVTTKIDQLFGTRKQENHEQAMFYEALVKRCIANGYKEGALIKTVKQWQAQTESHQDLHSTPVVKPDLISELPNIPDLLTDMSRGASRPGLGKGK